MDGTSTFYGATPPAPSLGGITAHLLQAGDSGLALYERYHSDTDGELIVGGFYINAAPAMNAVLGRALSTLAGIVEATVQLDVSIRRSLAANQGPLETLCSEFPALLTSGIQDSGLFPNWVSEEDPEDTKARLMASFLNFSIDVPEVVPENFVPIWPTCSHMANNSCAIYLCGMFTVDGNTSNRGVCTSQRNRTHYSRPESRLRLQIGKSSGPTPFRQPLSGQDRSIDSAVISNAVNSFGISKSAPSLESCFQSGRSIDPGTLCLSHRLALRPRRRPDHHLGASSGHQYVPTPLLQPRVHRCGS